MAAVPIQIDGVLWDHALKAGRKVTLMGSAFIMGLGPGGGPIIPPDTTPPDPGPPGHPEHPIVPPGGYPHPEHPIATPPDQPPDGLPPDLPTPVPPNSVIKAAPEGGWGLNSDSNGGIYWVYNPVVSPKG